MLKRIQTAIATALGIESLVTAPLDDLAVLYKKNLVGAADGGQTMSDHKSRTTGDQGPQCLLDQRLRLRVQA